MANKAAKFIATNLIGAVGACFLQLRLLFVDLDTYGSEDNASKLRGVIAALERACPIELQKSPTDFVIADTFKVQRVQVAQLLACSFVWHEITGQTPPPALGLRSSNTEVIPAIDYPLNEGGNLRVRRCNAGGDLLRLDLDAIAKGLVAMAVEYPRHFADFVNGTADPVWRCIPPMLCIRRSFSTGAPTQDNVPLRGCRTKGTLVRDRQRPIISSQLGEPVWLHVCCHRLGEDSSPRSGLARRQHPYHRQSARH